MDPHDHLTFVAPASAPALSPEALDALLALLADTHRRRTERLAREQMAGAA